MRQLAMLWAVGVLVGSLAAAQRTVLFEDFTATWCGPCGSAAPALEQLRQEVGDSLAIVGIHAGSGDPFYQTQCYTRYGYYGVQYIPTVYADGMLHYTGSSSAYSHYRQMFNLRKGVDQMVRFRISGEYRLPGREGTLQIVLQNEGSTDLNGSLRIYRILVDTPYVWQGHSHLYWVGREMLPSASGVPVSLPPEGWDTVTVDFQVPSYDSEEKTAFVIFLQRDDTHEVLGTAPEFPLDSLPWVAVEESPRVVAPRPGLRAFARPGGVQFEVQGLTRPRWLRVYEVTGREIWSRPVQSGTFGVSLRPGVYLYRLGSLSGKVVVPR